MDISNLSLPELQSLLEIIPEEITRRKRQEKQRVLQEMEVLASAAGFSLAELFDPKSVIPTKAKKTVAAKYRHPENSGLEWTGRGRQPKWVAEFLAAGGNIEQLAI